MQYIQYIDLLYFNTISNKDTELINNIQEPKLITVKPLI